MTTDVGNTLFGGRTEPHRSFSRWIIILFPSRHVIPSPVGIRCGRGGLDQ